MGHFAALESRLLKVFIVVVVIVVVIIIIIIITGDQWVIVPTIFIEAKNVFDSTEFGQCAGDHV